LKEFDLSLVICKDSVSLAILLSAKRYMRGLCRHVGERINLTTNDKWRMTNDS
jgi:hypothetical protein